MSWFNLPSFLIGFVLAFAIVGGLYRLRGRLAQGRDWALARAASLRRFFLAGAEYRYRQGLARSVQSNHLAGRIVELDRIFVPPRLVALLPIADPASTTEPEPDITFVVPAFPDMPEMAALYGAPALTVEQALASPASLVILGPAGAGKSVMLAHMAARLGREPELEIEGRTPLLVHAADLDLPEDGSTLKDPAEPLLVAAEARTSLLAGANVAEHLHNRLRDGKGLVLLDGWDELPPAHQAEVAKWLKIMLAAYTGTRVIAAGPAAGYRPLVALGLVAVPIAGWTPDDFRQLVERWTAVWPAVVARRKRKPMPGEADPALIAGWLSGGSRGRTPLEITLRIWTALEGDVIGPRPVDWLAAYVARLLPAPDGLRALERAALESLAEERYGIDREKLRDYTNMAFAMSAATLPMDPGDFLDQTLQRGGLMARRAGGRASFSHPVVAAYLAMAQQATANRPDPFMGQTGPVYAPVYPLYASLGDATPLVVERLKRPPDLAQSDLMSAGQWLADSSSNSRWRGEVLRRLAALLLASDEPELLRGRALAALVGSRDETVNQLFKKSLESADVVARTYAALGLGASGDPAFVPFLVARLADPARPAQWAAALALGSIGDLPAVRALTGAMNEGDDGLRRAAAEALSMNREDGFHVLREALSANDLLTRRAAIYGLRRMRPTDEIIKLLEDVHFNDTQWVVRGAAEEALAALKAQPEARLKPHPPPEQIGWLVAWAAERGEGVAPGESGRFALRRALNEGDVDTRIAAAQTLARLALSEAGPDLQGALKAASADVRDAAYRALFELSMATGRRMSAADAAPA